MILPQEFHQIIYGLQESYGKTVDELSVYNIKAITSLYNNLDYIMMADNILFQDFRKNSKVELKFILKMKKNRSTAILYKEDDWYMVKYIANLIIAGKI